MVLSTGNGKKISMIEAEATHWFSATHRHLVPDIDGKGVVMSKTHTHHWVLTVRVEGEVHPVYGWVMDFRELRRLLADIAPHRRWWSRWLRRVPDYEKTAEGILALLVDEVNRRLGPDGPSVAWARLEEMVGQAAVCEFQG